jgi:hypothetical protein
MSRGKAKTRAVFAAIVGEALKRSGGEADECCERRYSRDVKS